MPGSYSGSVMVTVIGSGNAPFLLPVNLTIPVPPVLSASLSQLSFAYPGTGTVSSQTLNVSATSPAAFAASSSSGWLAVTPASGALPASFTVSVDPAALNPGSYTGEITINAPGAANNPLVVPVGLTVASPPPMVLTVATAFGEAPLIAPNTWVEIRGTRLAPPADSRIWQSSDFVGNQLPTQLDGVSATVNGKRAFVYSINPGQVEILTPPDPLSGAVPVQLTANGLASNIVNVAAQAQSPSFFGLNYVSARHGADNSIVSTSSPAKPGEMIYITGNGFGPTNIPVVSGSMSQSGTLPMPWPAIQIGGMQATVTFAGLVGIGTYQFNVIVPGSLADGDLPITATYNGSSTQPGLLISIQH